MCRREKALVTQHAGELALYLPVVTIWNSRVINGWNAAHKNIHMMKFMAYIKACLTWKMTVLSSTDLLPVYIHSHICLLWDCRFKFISTCAHPNCVHGRNSWNFSLLCLALFFFFSHFKNCRQVLHLKQSLIQFNLLDHRHDQILRWEVQNSSPLPSAKPRQEGCVVEVLNPAKPVFL